LLTVLRYHYNVRLRYPHLALGNVELVDASVLGGLPQMLGLRNAEIMFRLFRNRYRHSILLDVLDVLIYKLFERRELLQVYLRTCRTDSRFSFIEEFIRLLLRFELKTLVSWLCIAVSIDRRFDIGGSG
jgi:hypothetical protein